MASESNDLCTFLSCINKQYTQYADRLKAQGITAKDISWMGYDDCHEFDISLLHWIEIVGAAKKQFGGWNDDEHILIKQWSCVKCTYSNKLQSKICEMCMAKRPKHNKPITEEKQHHRKLDSQAYELSKEIAQLKLKDTENKQIIEGLNNKNRIWKEKYNELNKAIHKINTDKYQLTKQIQTLSDEKRILTEKVSKYTIKLKKVVKQLKEYKANVNENSNVQQNESELVRLQINIDNLTFSNEKLQTENCKLKLENDELKRHIIDMTNEEK
eukprot:73330_1